MQLSQLITDLPQLASQPSVAGLEVTGITADSRQVSPGVLFVAYSGIATDGHQYIPNAVAAGAVAVVGEKPLDALHPALPASVPYLQVADGRAALAWLHAAWYGHPSRSMIVVGVTGTDGKTTTANLLFAMLRAGGVRAGMISTVNAVIGDETYDTGLHTTTPDAADIQRYLAQMRDVGTEVVVLETTSHGLAQHRVTGVDYDVAVVTNITHEHLDFHGSYEAYREAKAMLFRSLLARQGAQKKLGASRLAQPAKTAVLNADDSSFAYLSRIPAQRYVVYKVGGARAKPPAPETDAHVTSLRASRIRQEPSEMSFEVEVLEAGQSLMQLQLTTKLIGQFNVSNIMAAAGAALVLGLDQDAIRAGVAALSGVRGRMERIDRGQPFYAVVDFAHTPNALLKAINAARDLVVPCGHVIVVFGSAGLRDREKRRLMGKVAAQHANYTVITAEDPRTEDLAAIMQETAEAMLQVGLVEGRDFVRIADRQRAILHGVESAAGGDIVLVCGKGHEQSMCFGQVEHPWRDQDALEWAVDQWLGKKTPPPFTLPTWSAK